MSSEKVPDTFSSIRRNRVWIWPAVVALIAAALYANTLGNEFALDDVNIVRDNPHLRSLSELPRLFALPYWPDAAGSTSGLYRPVTI